MSVRISTLRLAALMGLLLVSPHARADDEQLKRSLAQLGVGRSEMGAIADMQKDFLNKLSDMRFAERGASEVNWKMRIAISEPVPGRADPRNAEILSAVQALESFNAGRHPEGGANRAVQYKILTPELHDALVGQGKAEIEAARQAGREPSEAALKNAALEGKYVTVYVDRTVAANDAAAARLIGELSRHVQSRMPPAGTTLQPMSDRRVAEGSRMFLSYGVHAGPDRYEVPREWAAKNETWLSSNRAFCSERDGTWYVNDNEARRLGGMSVPPWKERGEYLIRATATVAVNPESPTPRVRDILPVARTSNAAQVDVRRMVSDVLQSRAAPNVAAGGVRPFVQRGGAAAPAAGEQPPVQPEQPRGAEAPSSSTDPASRDRRMGLLPIAIVERAERTLEEGQRRLDQVRQTQVARSTGPSAERPPERFVPEIEDPDQVRHRQISLDREAERADAVERRCRSELADAAATRAHHEWQINESVRRLASNALMSIGLERYTMNERGDIVPRAGVPGRELTPAERSRLVEVESLSSEARQRARETTARRQLDQRIERLDSRTKAAERATTAAKQRAAQQFTSVKRVHPNTPPSAPPRPARR